MAKWQGNRFVSGRSGVRSPLPAFVYKFFFFVQKSDTFSICVVSSLRRGHANLLCIVPILSYETAFTPLTYRKIVRTQVFVVPA